MMTFVAWVFIIMCGINIIGAPFMIGERRKEIYYTANLAVSQMIEAGLLIWLLLQLV